MFRQLEHKRNWSKVTDLYQIYALIIFDCNGENG